MKEQNLNEVKKDFNLIDIGKVTALFCVVMMHTICDNFNPIFKIVQMGCMAYFFFASGFCFKESYSEYSTLKFIAKNIRAQIIPYFLGAFIGIFVCFKFPEFYTNDLKEIFEMILIECKPIAFGLVWFLFVLFQIRIVFFILWKILGKIKNFVATIIFVVLVYLVFIFFTIYLVNNNIRLPYKVDVASVAMTFYILGFIVKYTGIYKYLNKLAVAMPLLIASKYIAVYLETNFIKCSNIVEFLFDDYLIWQIIQILSIISFLCIGVIFSKVTFLVYLGKNTFYPYLIHAYVSWLVEELYAKYISGYQKYAFSDIREILLLSLISFVASYIIGYVLKLIINS